LSQSTVDGLLGLSVLPALSVVFAADLVVDGACVGFSVVLDVVDFSVGVAVTFCVDVTLSGVVGISSELLSLSASSSRLMDAFSIDFLT
jgi:hypothetical protein